MKSQKLQTFGGSSSTLRQIKLYAGGGGNVLHIPLYLTDCTIDV
jgi:hypothetical protein